MDQELDDIRRKLDAARELGLDLDAFAMAALIYGLRAAVLAVGAKRAGELAQQVAAMIRQPEGGVH